MSKAKAMTVGEVVATRYRRQYWSKKYGWRIFEGWQIQPEQIYLILLELKSKAAVDALMGSDSWTKRIPKRTKADE